VSVARDGFEIPGSLPYDIMGLKPLEMPPGELRRIVERLLDETLVRDVRAGGPGDVAALIDHTLLGPQATRTDIERLCDEAIEFAFATVCVNPTWTALAARRLAGRRVGVCTVAGFPFGAATSDVKQFEARRALFDGAREIDMVINIGALKSGDLALVQRDIEAVAGPVSDAGGLTKVIIEASLLTDEEKISACRLAEAGGAQYVKTSTGFGPGGAAVADVALMRRIVGSRMGVKAAGGIRDLETLKSLVAAGATRIGASASVRIVQESRGITAGHDAAEQY
jgi:deoxyribose-phosphate aldolase